jgi:16S rRNA U1498 N3-methylase RsmE
MRTHRVYFPDISENANEVIVGGQAGSHLSKVLRVRTGHSIILFDGLNNGKGTGKGRVRMVLEVMEMIIKQETKVS